MPIIETEIWKADPDRRGVVVFDSQRDAKDVFKELEAHLIADGRLPDEYFLFDSHSNWSDGALFPKDADIVCEVNFGGSEGVYLDIFVKYEKEVYGRDQDTGYLGLQKRRVAEHFATGKTLGESIEDLDRMNLAASSVTAAFYGSKAEVWERYTKIESGEATPVFLSAEQRAAEALKALEKESAVTSKTIYGEVKPGDWVIAAGSNDYRYLIGTVAAIDKLGNPNHCTENETDDIHVDFTAFDYPPERIAEIEGRFGAPYGNIALDDIIMAPEMLICISNLGQDEIERMGKLRQNCESFCNCFPNGEPLDGRIAELMLRLEANLEEFHESLMGVSKRELIEMSDGISAVSDAYSYMASRHEYNDSELAFFLEFQNPLALVAEAWQERKADLSDMSYAIDCINERQDEFRLAYPLMSTEQPQEIPDEPAKTQGKPDKADQPAAKPRTLAEKMKAANNKVKAQETSANNNILKSHNREER